MVLKVANKRSYGGLPFLLRRAVRVCFSPLGTPRIMICCQKDLTQPMEEVKGKVDVNVCQASESDIGQLEMLVSENLRQEIGHERYTRYFRLGVRGTILDRFQLGQKCFLGKIGTEIVHYNWIFFNWEESVSGRFIHLKEDEALMDDAFTVERWRGKAIHTVVHNRMLLFLKQNGYRRAYTLVGAFNNASQKTHHRLGWDLTGMMLVFIRRRSRKAWIWRIKGNLEPFVYEKIPSGKDWLTME